MERCMFIFLLLIVCIFIQDSRCKKRGRNSKPSSQRYNHPKSLRREENLHFFKDYRRYQQIQKFMRGLVKKHSSIAKVFSIGTSIEGRKLDVIQIGSISKPAIWIDGGTHAREWISPTTVLYIAYKLVTEYSERFRENENKFSWYILPVANPDGYEYSHEKDRMWRKNRNPKNKKCPGVDLNRNWGYHWNGGSSLDACSELYSGESAFSEPETRAISNFLRTKMQRQGIAAFLTFHSYGQLLLYPWGWTHSLPDDHRDLEKVANKIADAIHKVNGSKYDVSSVTEHFKTVLSGGSQDWAKGEAGIKYSYAVELPNKNKYGFKLPKKYILPTARDLWAGVKALATAISHQNEEH